MFRNSECKDTRARRQGHSVSLPNVGHSWCIPLAFHRPESWNMTVLQPQSLRQKTTTACIIPDPYSKFLEPTERVSEVLLEPEALTSSLLARRSGSQPCWKSWVAVKEFKLSCHIIQEPHNLLLYPCGGDLN